MIIKIGAAVIDGTIPDESANTPIETIDTSEGAIILERPLRERGFEQSISVNLAQSAANSILRGYMSTQSTVAVAFIDQVLSQTKHICNARIIGVDMAPIDQSAMELLNLTTMSPQAPESVYSGSLRIVVL